MLLTSNRQRKILATLVLALMTASLVPIFMSATPVNAAVVPTLKVLPVQYTFLANVTVTVYDELGFFIGSALLSTTVGWGYYVGTMPPPLLTYPTWDPIIPLPTNAVVGQGVVFGNVYDNLPWNGGTPYAPEVTNTISFFIVKP